MSVLVKDFGKYELKELEKLPKQLNRSLLRTLSKRGLLIDDNIQAVFFFLLKNYIIFPDPILFVLNKVHKRHHKSIGAKRMRIVK